LVISTLSKAEGELVSLSILVVEGLTAGETEALPELYEVFVMEVVKELEPELDPEPEPEPEPVPN